MEFIDFLEGILLYRTQGALTLRTYERQKAEAQSVESSRAKEQFTCLRERKECPFEGQPGLRVPLLSSILRNLCLAVVDISGSTTNKQKSS